MGRLPQWARNQTYMLVRPGGVLSGALEATDEVTVGGFIARVTTGRWGGMDDGEKVVRPVMVRAM